MLMTVRRISNKALGLAVLSIAAVATTVAQATAGYCILMILGKPRTPQSLVLKD